ncbi:MAG: 6,7-dimethyl-8-ribityllumazine synthase [Pikeienuella sp.]
MNQSTETTHKPLRFAFIGARWHAHIVDQARHLFIEEIDRRTNQQATVDIFDAPGAFEIPLMAQRLAKSGLYDGIVGAAFVVDGGIYRHDFVSEAVVNGLMQAQLATETPIFSVVLTPHHFQETETHEAFFTEHFKVKGREAAAAALSTIAIGATLPRAA